MEWSTRLQIKARETAFFARAHGRILGLLLAWTLVVATGLTWGPVEFIDETIESPLYLRTRDWLGLGPKISPRIKIYAYDDHSATTFRESSTPIHLWPAILRGVTDLKPAALIINVTYSIARIVSPDVSRSLEDLKTQTERMVAATVVSPYKLSVREPLTSKERPASWLPAQGLGPPLETQKSPENFVYGPEAPFRGVFPHLGHVMQPWSSKFPPFIKHRDYLIPHIGLYGASSIRTEKSQILVDEKPLPLDSQGLIPIDFVSTRDITPRIKTMRSLVDKIQNGTLRKEVNEGDVVLLIGAFGTGFTDMLTSPLGTIPAPFFTVSIVNSALTGRWLRQVDYSLSLTIILCLLGAFAGWRIHQRIFFPLTTILVLLTIGIAGGIFLINGVKIHWFIPCISWIGGSLLMYSAKRQEEGRRRVYLELERNTASSLQRDFLPPLETSGPGFSVAAFYQAAEAIGGDWYSYQLVKNRYLYLHIGDVTGHGTSAALLACYAKGATDLLHHRLGNASPLEPQLTQIHSSLNGIMRKASQDRLLMTLFSAVIDLSTGDAFFLNSAHQPAVLLLIGRHESKFVNASGSNILGFADDLQSLHVEHLKINPGDYVILCTDGLLNHMRHLFGHRHLRKLLDSIEKSEIGDARTLRSYFVNLLRNKHIAIATEEDDATMVIVKYEGPPAAA